MTPACCESWYPPDGPASSLGLLSTELFALSSATRLPLSAGLAFSLPLPSALSLFCVMLLIRMFSGSEDICCPSAHTCLHLSRLDFNALITELLMEAQ